MTVLNYLDKVFVGQFGTAITITVVDSTGTAVDVSAYTGTKTLFLTSPDEQKTVSLSATFSTDGTDGIVVATPANGDIDRIGDWKGQLQLKVGTTVVDYTKVFTMVVEEALG